MKIIRNSLIILLVFILTGISNNALGFLGFGNTTSWKEEVLLHDSTKIIVERWQKRGGLHSLDAKPAILEYSLSFKHPGTKEIIKWKDGPTEDIERASLKLVALHMKDNIPYVITTTYLGCRAYNKWGRPNPNYVIFKHEGNEWKRIPLSELPLEFKNVNLVIDTPAYDEENNFFQWLVTADAEKVKELNSNLEQGIYKTIVREPFKGEGDGRCPEMIYCGHGRWTSLNTFKRQASYETCLNECKIRWMDAEHCPCKRLFVDKKGEGK